MATLAERFWVRDRPGAYERAIAVLRALGEEHGLRAIERAYAEATAITLEEQATQGMKRRLVCANQLVGKCRHGRYEDPEWPCSLPGSDHTTMFTRKGMPPVYITQPYGITWENLLALVKRCEQQGLEADIDARWSWHFPGATISIIVTKAQPVR